MFSTPSQCRGLFFLIAYYLTKDSAFCCSYQQYQGCCPAVHQTYHSNAHVSKWLPLFIISHKFLYVMAKRLSLTHWVGCIGCSQFVVVSGLGCSCRTLLSTHQLPIPEVHLVPMVRSKIPHQQRLAVHLRVTDTIA